MEVGRKGEGSPALAQRPQRNKGRMKDQVKEEGRERKADTVQGAGGHGEGRRRQGPGLQQDYPHQEQPPTPRAGASQHRCGLELPGALGPGLLG